MLYLVPIALHETIPYMHLAFRDDPELNDYAEIKDIPTEQRVRNNYENLAKLNLDLQGWVIMLDESPIGFSVTCEQPFPMLTSFGINVSYRKKDVLLEWLDNLNDILGDNWMVAMMACNTRAIRFFERNGFAEVVNAEGSILMMRD